MKNYNLLKYIFCIICLFALAKSQNVLAEVVTGTPELKQPHTLTLAAGSLIKGILQSQISSEINSKGDTISLIIPFSMYIKDTVCIPENSVFTGTITELEKAKQGVDGYFKLEINKVYFPDGTFANISASIWSKRGNSEFGGDFAPRGSFKKVPHYNERLNGILQLVPDGERLAGKETKLEAGSELIIILNEDLNVVPF
jgi:hypothetical protein